MIDLSGTQGFGLMSFDIVLYIKSLYVVEASFRGIIPIPGERNSHIRIES